MSEFSADRCTSAGKDAARAYGTGCFSTHLTHDLRGLSEDELKVRSKSRTRARAPLRTAGRTRRRTRTRLDSTTEHPLCTCRASRTGSGSMRIVKSTSRLGECRIPRSTQRARFRSTVIRRKRRPAARPSRFRTFTSTKMTSNRRRRLRHLRLWGTEGVSYRHVYIINRSRVRIL